MRFANNRVRAASKKNFICFTDKMPSRDDSVLAAAHSPRRRKTVEQDIIRRASISSLDLDEEEKQDEEDNKSSSVSPSKRKKFHLETVLLRKDVFKSEKSEKENST